MIMNKEIRMSKREMDSTAQILQFIAQKLKLIARKINSIGNGIVLWSFVIVVCVVVVAIRSVNILCRY